MVWFVIIIVCVVGWAAYKVGLQEGRKLQMIDEQYRKAIEKTDQELIEQHINNKSFVEDRKKYDWVFRNRTGDEYYSWQEANIEACEKAMKNRGYEWQYNNGIWQWIKTTPN